MPPKYAPRLISTDGFRPSPRVRPMETYTDRTKMRHIIQHSYHEAFKDTKIQNKLSDMEVIFSGHIEDIDVWWHVHVENGKFTYDEGRNKQSQVHLLFSRAEVFNDIFNGEKDLVHYVKTGKVRFDGDEKLAKKLNCISRPFGAAYRRMMSEMEDE